MSIYEILKEYGMEVPEEKKAAFDKAWKENFKTKVEYDKVVNQRDEHKSSLDTVEQRLKGFEGVDVAELNSKIEKLQNDLETQANEYAAKEADRLFMDSLKEAIKTAGGRNPKAVLGMLDVETLKASKDQTEDIKKALDAVKESDAYLFGADEPINNPVGPTGTVITGLTKEQFSKMGYKERLELKQNNPAKYEEMRG